MKEQLPSNQKLVRNLAGAPASARWRRPASDAIDHPQPKTGIASHDFPQPATKVSALQQKARASTGLALRQRWLSASLIFRPRLAIESRSHRWRRGVCRRAWRAYRFLSGLARITAERDRTGTGDGLAPAGFPDSRALSRRRQNRERQVEGGLCFAIFPPYRVQPGFLA